MEDTGAASCGRATRLPRAGRGGRRREGSAGRAAGRRRGCGGRCDGRRGGPSPALLPGPTSPSKNQVAMKSDQSACPPPREDRVCVVVPRDFKHGMNTLLWALLNVANNGERLFIVHVHRHKHIRRKGVEKKLGDYVAMCNACKVSCDLKIIKNGHVAKALAELIDREGITKLVMRGAGDERYSEEMKSPEFNTAIKLMKAAPLTCKIWFTCNGQLICTREANATVPAIQPPPMDSHALKMAKKKIHTGRASDIKYRQGNIVSHTKAKGPSQRSRNERGAKKRLQERKDKEKLPTFRKKKDKEKSYQRDLKNAEKEKLRLEKPIEEVEYLEEIARSAYFLQEPETAVTEFSEDEIEESINCLDNTLIGNGGSGNVYKGRLRNTVVAIKKLHRGSMQEESDFIRKVAVLGRVRHPNIVTLIGVCREVFGLVYEFLPNGSLQDQLVACRNGKMPPLKWQVRIKIIREIWTVLTFLHSSKPPLVHGNLKPSKVLLDSNFTCKLEASAGIFQSNGTPTAIEDDDDVHSFGIIALQLLMMWLSPEKDDVVKVVDEANKKGELDTVLDTTAWDWPPELAKRLAHIGLRCVGISGGLESPAEAPPDDLSEEVRQLFVAADRFAAASQDEAEAQAPDHFRCPISNVLMVDPHIATDGHTYEREGINTWFSYGNDTSPVTREMIADKKLILNRTVKWMIEDWKEEQQRQVRTTLTICDPNPVQSSLQRHPTIPPAAQSQPPTGLHPDPVTSRSLTPLDTSAEAQLQLQLQPPPASSSPPTTLISSTTDARSRSTAPLNTSAASARSPRLNPLAANPSAAAPPPPPRPVSPSSTDFLPPPTGIRRRHVNGRLPSSSTETDVPAGPGETSRIRGKFKHQ